MALPDEVFDSIVYKIKVEKQLELAAYQPKFIIDQLVASCRFMEEPVHLEPRYLDYTIDNLRVRRNSQSNDDLESAHPMETLVSAGVFTSV